MNPESKGPDCSDRLVYATAEIAQFQGLIRFADAKAGAAITFGSALLTVLVANFPNVISVLRGCSQPWQPWLGPITLLFTLLFFGAFVLVLYYAFLTLLPRLESKEDKPKPTVAFFLDVYMAGKDSAGEDFVQQVSAMSPQELLEHTLREIYLLSEILRMKFKTQALCFRFLRLVLVFWVFAQVGTLLA